MQKKLNVDIVTAMDKKINTENAKKVHKSINLFKADKFDEQNSRRYNKANDFSEMKKKVLYCPVKQE